jgi:hypothetical protein
MNKNLLFTDFSIVLGYMPVLPVNPGNYKDV